MRILLVDDDPSMHRLLTAMLRKMGHEVIHANDGQEAWELLNNDNINFVLSDWRMPRMDGVELSKNLRKTEFSHYIYVVLFTGKDDTDDMVIAMEAGADDFLTKPVDARELEVCIEAGRRVLSLEASLREKNDELRFSNEALKASQERIQKDLQAAARIQQDLLPQYSPECDPIKFAWDLMPAEELAGDIFNFYLLDEHHVGFYMVDVSGHGIPAAMLSVHLARSLSAEPRPDSLVRLSTDEIGQSSVIEEGLCKESTIYREPKEVAARLNNQFQNDDESMLYFTMIYGVLDKRDGVGKLCQAGHPYPLICRHDGSVERLGSGGFPIGLVDDAYYEQLDFQLNSGDRLLLYSDGITECINPQKQDFGESNLANCLSICQKSSLRETVEYIKTKLAEWHHPGDANLHLRDDASLLAIEFLTK
ncbi:MAG: SpoIIE family protein phosphatase [Gammaproteobacteria bacterium]|nr:SpoIIE family protein phosphatase [Gammaproteobacteria bacterium]